MTERSRQAVQCATIAVSKYEWTFRYGSPAMGVGVDHIGSKMASGRTRKQEGQALTAELEISRIVIGPGRR
ncbi:hypothetical protein ABIB25_005288 [Nakamurella sp. UYEF19]